MLKARTDNATNLPESKSLTHLRKDSTASMLSALKPARTQVAAASPTPTQLILDKENCLPLCDNDESKLTDAEKHAIEATFSLNERATKITSEELATKIASGDPTLTDDDDHDLEEISVEFQKTF